MRICQERGRDYQDKEHGEIRLPPKEMRRDCGMDYDLYQRKIKEKRSAFSKNNNDLKRKIKSDAEYIEQKKLTHSKYIEHYQICHMSA